jgi:hypothetical protein
MKKGFILITVMIILFLMGTEFFALTNTSNFIAIETNNILLEADRQNLISSGLVWARHNAAAKDGIELAADGIAPHDAYLKISPTNNRQIVLTISSRRGGRTIKTEEKYSSEPKKY